MNVTEAKHSRTAVVSLDSPKQGTVRDIENMNKQSSSKRHSPNFSFTAGYERTETRKESRFIIWERKTCSPKGCNLTAAHSRPAIRHQDTLRPRYWKRDAPSADGLVLNQRKATHWEPPQSGSWRVTENPNVHPWWTKVWGFCNWWHRTTETPGQGERARRLWLEIEHI